MLWIMMASVPIAYAQSLTGDSWAEASAAKSGCITVTYVETPGLVYKTSDGQLTGVCVDILKDFGAWLQEDKGVSISLSFVGSGTSFGEMYASVKDGSNGVIGLGNITIRESRKEEVSFSPAFMNSFAILASHKSVPELSALDKISTEFAGMKAYAAKGTTNEQRIMDLKQKHYADLEVTPVSSSPEAMQQVLQDTRPLSYLSTTFYLDAVTNFPPLLLPSLPFPSLPSLSFPRPWFFCPLPLLRPPPLTPFLDFKV